VHGGQVQLDNFIPLEAAFGLKHLRVIADLLLLCQLAEACET
jgi:hypothetical protein